MLCEQKSYFSALMRILSATRRLSSSVAIAPPLSVPALARGHRLGQVGHAQGREEVARRRDHVAALLDDGLAVHLQRQGQVDVGVALFDVTRAPVVPQLPRREGLRRLQSTKQWIFRQKRLKIGCIPNLRLFLQENITNNGKKIG